MQNFHQGFKSVLWAVGRVAERGSVTEKSGEKNRIQ